MSTAEDEGGDEGERSQLSGDFTFSFHGMKFTLEKKKVKYFSYKKK